VLLSRGRAAGGGLQIELLVLAMLFAITAWAAARMQHRDPILGRRRVLRDDRADRRVPVAALGGAVRLPDRPPWLVARIWLDDVHWNLWSNFGSRPFHALLLALYLGFSVAMIGWIHFRATRTDVLQRGNSSE
jgi:hypothetical protein